MAHAQVRLMYKSLFNTNNDLGAAQQLPYLDLNRRLR